MLQVCNTEWPGAQPQFGRESQIGRFPKEAARTRVEARDGRNQIELPLWDCKQNFAKKHDIARL